MFKEFTNALGRHCAFTEDGILTKGTALFGNEAIDLFFPYGSIESISTFMGLTIRGKQRGFSFAINDGDGREVKKLVREFKRNRYKYPEATEYKVNYNKEKSHYLAKNIIPQESIQNDDGKYYETCKNAGVTELNDEFSKKKAIVLLKTFFGAKPEDTSLSIYEEQVSRCFEISKTAWLVRENRRVAEQKRQEEQEAILKLMPTTATLTEEAKKHIRLVENTMRLIGLEKRRKLLTDAYEELNDTINKKIEGEKALKQLGQILGASVYQEKKRDWAFLSGIAAGIGGPAIGAATAIDIMADNNRIEYENQQRRGAVAKTIQTLQNNSGDLTAEIDELRKACALLSNEMEQLEQKIVLTSYNQETLFESLKISATIQKTSENLLYVHAKIKNTLKPIVPDGVKTTIDGILKAEIYANETFVGYAYLPLPTYGIACEESENLVGICTKHLIDVDKYTFKITPDKLWLMEL